MEQCDDWYTWWVVCYIILVPYSKDATKMVEQLNTAADRCIKGQCTNVMDCTRHGAWQEQFEILQCMRL